MRAAPFTWHVVRVGDGLDLEEMARLATDLSGRLGGSCQVHPEVIDDGFARSEARGQYYSTPILARLAGFPVTSPGRLLAVTAHDLFVPILTFVFGEAQLAGHCALVSTHRLQERYYGLPARPALEHERLLKEALHELGHTFGLRHCQDWQCAMAASHSVERLDVKRADYCLPCQDHVRRGLQTVALGVR